MNIQKEQIIFKYLQNTTVNDKVFGAVWSEKGVVNIYDLNSKLKEVEKAKRNRKIGSVEKKKKFGKPTPKRIISEHKPLHSFSGHRDEGFALDWSSKSPGIYYLYLLCTSLRYLYTVLYHFVC